LPESSGLSSDFTALLAARSLSWVGDGIANVALVIHLQRTDGTGRAVGLLLLVTMLPSVLAPFTGVVVDRYDRRRVLATAEYAQAVVGAVVVVWLPALAPLLILVLVKSIAATLTDIAGRSAIADLVPRDRLVVANAWFGGARQAGDVLGPLLGGVLVAVSSVRTAIAVDVATFVVAVPLLLRLPALRPTPAHGAARHWLADARAGLSYIARHRVARAVTVGFFVVGLTAADDVALPFLARDLGAGDVGVGVIYAAVAAGLVVGFVALGRGRITATPVAGFVGGCLVLGVGEVLTGLAGALAVAVTFQLVRGLGAAAIDVHLQTLLQRSVPPDTRGRVFANVYGAVGLAAAISTGVAGPLVDATAPGTVLVLAGLVAFAAAAATTVLLRRERS
jgi:MFS family permease